MTCEALGPVGAGRWGFTGGDRTLSAISGYSPEAASESSDFLVACDESTSVLPIEHCPNCGGELKIIAAILEQPMIEKMLIHLGLLAWAPPCAPARGQALQPA